MDKTIQLGLVLYLEHQTLNNMLFVHMFYHNSVLLTLYLCAAGRNVFLSVMVDASDLPWNVTCTFLSGYSAGENVVCEMSFRSADASGAGVSTMAGGDGDTVVILINNSSTGGGPPAMTEYRYDVTTSSTTTRAIVRGTFVSGDYAVGECVVKFQS